MGMPKELKPNKKKTPAKKTTAAKKKPSKKKATKKKVATNKGQRVRATRAATGAGATKKAQSFDKKINEILEKMGHPVDYPLQISDPINCMHTGLFMLDLILCGGYRKGRMYTHIGRPNAGKSTLIQEAIAAAQRAGRRVFFFDIEESAARVLMVRQGIIPDATYKCRDGSRGFRYLNPETGEEFYEMALALLDALPPDPDPNTPPQTILVVDSYESITSEAITDKKKPIGTFGRMHSIHQKRLRKRLKRAGATLVATNQLRVSGIGGMFVNPEDEAGGYALKYYSDAKTKLNFKKPGADGAPKGVVPIRIKTTRNRMADPFKEAQFRLILGRGYDRLYDRLKFLVTLGEIKTTGSYYIIKGKKLQAKRAREAMKDPYFRKLCFYLRKKMSTYEGYFNVFGTDEMDWDNQEAP
jgi:recombination protein RecA